MFLCCVFFTNLIGHVGRAVRELLRKESKSCCTFNSEGFWLVDDLFKGENKLVKLEVLYTYHTLWFSGDDGVLLCMCVFLTLFIQTIFFIFSNNWPGSEKSFFKKYMVCFNVLNQNKILFCRVKFKKNILILLKTLSMWVFLCIINLKQFLFKKNTITHFII